jgi:hypothetical protein
LASQNDYKNNYMLESHLKFVNEQLVFQQKMLEKLVHFHESPKKIAFHKDLISKFEALHNYLLEHQKAVSGAPSASTSTSKQLRLSLNPRDLEGAPEELLKELSISDDRTEMNILALLDEHGGIASLDQIIFGLYKKTKEIVKRQAMTNRLYRMGQKELIWGVPGKKGVYSNRPISDQEAASLFGVEPSES